MGSSILHTAEVEEIELLSRQQSEAHRRFREQDHPRAYTSPRALNQFIQGTLPELPDRSRCRSHELLLVPTQTFEDNQTVFLSTVCGKCHFHFHVKSDAKHSLPNNAKHPNHMLIPHQTRSKDDLRREHTKYRKPEGYVRFVCAARSCNFWLEISTFAPKLSRNEVDMLQNNGRVQLNLKEARNEDPERYADVGDDYGTDTATILQKYLHDALGNPPAEGGPRKIKKRNKRFKVSFSSDFDPLLRSLGFIEGMDDESGDTYWVICQPEQQRDITPVGTLRAQVEDAEAEVALLCHGKETIPAWQNLLRAFGGVYSNVAPDQSISEDDLALLGCLNDYPPRLFSWAARLLSDVRPSHRDKYLEAALRCIRERDEEAQSEIVMYQSQFDTISTVDESLQQAYKFFNANGADRDSVDYLLSKYYVMAQADRTDAARALAQQHLEVIGHHLGTDIVGRIDPQILDDMGAPALIPASAGPRKRRMSIGSATRLLGVDAVFSPELIRDFVLNLDEKADRDKVAEALEVLSELKRQQDRIDDATKLQEFATFFRETGSVPIDLTTSTTPQQSQEPSDYMNRPPGLRNIGNTCYLNSLLQYFYNVKIVRDLINHFDQIKLELDEAVLSKRRTGGSGNTVNLEEAIVARQFVEMLGELFNQLQSTTDAAAQPSQKLANTALSSAKDILSERKPPPLPARPSPAPPVPPKEDTDMVHVSVESVNDHLETASSHSSRTLVEEEDKATPTESFVHLVDVEGRDNGVQDTIPQPLSFQLGEDVKMEDAEAHTSLDEKIALVSQRLEQSERSGTSQQDVEEIIGNILEHLMRAIRSDGPMAGKPDLQSDKITETFFTMIVNSTAQTTSDSPSQLNALGAVEDDILNEEIIPERWITAFPHPDKENKVKVTLYAALDRYFTYELLSGGSLARYSTIRSLPPILHICIQRSDASGIKNRNAVMIPEVLYLDRYMEAETGSHLWKVRRRVWAIKERIEELDSRSAKDPQQVIRRDGADDWQTSNFFNDAWDEEPSVDDIYSINVDPGLMSDIVLPSKRKALGDLTSLPPPKRASSNPVSNTNGTSVEFSSALDDLEQNLKRMNEMTSAELSDLRKRAEADFDDMKKEKYSLHAVICHGGGMLAGHYWVWIRDFEKNVWYKYNDSMVTEDTRDSQAVLDELNDSGDPYYVAYVRDEMKHDLVEVPQRPKPDTNAAVSDDVEMVIIDGVEPGTKLGVPGSSGSGSSSRAKAAEFEPAMTTGSDESRPYEIL